MDPLDFSGKVVLVTGGGRGVGAGISDRFVAAGAQVVICGRHKPDESHRTTWVEADVRDAEQVERLIGSIADSLGRLDVAVNNAGGSPVALAADASPRFVSAIIALNLLGPIYVAQKANALMQGQPDGGSIVNIASVSGMRPTPGTSAYGAAKAGLINLTQTLAVEWAPKVRVNCVTGGLIKTEQWRLHYGDEAGLARVAASVPLERMGEPADIGNACLFLSSPLASYVSGANLAVYGGGEPPSYLAAAQGV